jgi:hypothetical protein
MTVKIQLGLSKDIESTMPLNPVARESQSAPASSQSAYIVMILSLRIHDVAINDKDLLLHFEVFNKIGMRDAAEVILLKNITYIGDLNSGLETTLVCAEHAVRPPQGRRNSNELSMQVIRSVESVTPQFKAPSADVTSPSHPHCPLYSPVRPSASPRNI